MISVRVTNTATPAFRDITKQMHAALVDGFWAAVLHLEGTVKETIFKVFPQGRTGGLANSFAPRWIKKDKTRLTAGVYSSLVYAAIQDVGGTIRPKTVKNLAIPVSERAKKTVGKWPRHYAKGKLQLIKSKKGNWLLVEMYKRRKNPTIKEVMFVLKKQVTISPKHYLMTATEAAVPGITQILSSRVEQVIGGGK